MRLKAIMPSIFTSELTLGKSIANLCTKLVLQYWREQQQTGESFVMLKEEIVSSLQHNSSTVGITTAFFN